MAALLDLPLKVLGTIYESAREAPLHILLGVLISTAVSSGLFLYALVYLLAPIPRAPHPSEKTYITTHPSGSATSPKPLPCWHDSWLEHRNDAATPDSKGRDDKHTGSIDEPEVEMSVVIPAYNEEERIVIMLEEAIAFLDTEYGRSPRKGKANGSAKSGEKLPGIGGYEILIVNDGSKDKTVDIALDFSRKNGLHDILRVCTLEENRGKGGAVTHGFRHVRGRYAVFADADGASRFEDLRKLVEGSRQIEDGPGRGIAVGSRAHLVGSEAVVKLFSRASLPHIVPYMHAEGWIFDVEMLMLAESAPASDGGKTANGIRVAEVQIGWQEVGGSKLNVVWDSLAMAWGLAILRASWILGVYRRR
ncbi:glycosyl transferase family 2-domain-containing protein [Halenospora varia]|nr:glycosyl transferase family 2-domain-containing protein [Halenospora varia]